MPCYLYVTKHAHCILMLLLLSHVTCIQCAPCSGYTWEWASGSSTLNLTADYSPASVEVNALSAAALASLSDEIYLFGGMGADQLGYNNLWTATLPAHDVWDFIDGTQQGSPPENVAWGQSPPARAGAAYWSSDGLYVYGGRRSDSVGPDEMRDDLWYHNGTAWEFLGNSTGAYNAFDNATWPGAVTQTCFASYGDSLYLVSGRGNDPPGDDGRELNFVRRRDYVFEYSKSRRQWKWRFGTRLLPLNNIRGPLTNYTANIPGTRMNAALWATETQLFMFGGNGNEQTELGLESGYFADMWVFHLQNNSWEFYAGPEGVSQQGRYSSGIRPGSRVNTQFWSDNAGYLWLYGGEGYGSGTQQGVLCDMWRFTPTTALWELMLGNGTADLPPLYTQRTVVNSEAFLGGRRNGVVTTTEEGDVLIYGGDSKMGYMNDLWRGHCIAAVPSISTSLSTTTSTTSTSTSTSATTSTTTSSSTSSTTSSTTTSSTVVTSSTITTGSSTDCGPNPFGPEAVCIDGKWIINGDIDVPINSTIFVPVIIDGNANFTRIIVTPGGSITITGCANFSGEIVIPLVTPPSNKTLYVLNADCIISRFSKITIKPGYDTLCEVLSGEQVETARGMEVMLVSDRSKCKNKTARISAIIGGVIAGFVVLILIVLFIVYCVHFRNNNASGVRGPFKRKPRRMDGMSQIDPSPLIKAAHSQ